MNSEITTTRKVELIDIRMDSKTYPRLKTYTRIDAVAEMSKIVAQAFLYKGNQADPNNIQFISGALVDELMTDAEGLGAQNITFAEIGRVIKKAILTDELYGISVATLYKAVMDYIKGEGHRLTVEARERKAKQEQIELKQSIIAPMLEGYSEQMLKKSKH